ncbi:hypothetical protein G9F32_11325 [Acinetobacter sp. 194]|uniref:hypothetical protein n=1 Tax=Acinetobacter shaoyimingii TaxID=2715164 RepID=UPI0014083BA9|nr:hypothetical protein [Acinetobacter shaoyimingii]NHB58599.1 hypothetical protein [Acinetobacter shaoyimingii]
MIKKELSITELFGVLSIIGISITVISNTYFYYQLDAIWMTSLLSPTFYLFEVFKVMLVFCSAVIFVDFFVERYDTCARYLYRKILRKKSFKFDVLGHNHSFIKAQMVGYFNRYTCFKTLFLTFLLSIPIIVLKSMHLVNTANFFWLCVLLGLIAGLQINRHIKQDKIFHYFILFLIIVICSFITAHIKLDHLNDLPIAVLKSSSDDRSWLVLESSNDKTILLNAMNHQDFKIVKFEEIDRIISKKK